MNNKPSHCEQQRGNLRLLYKRAHGDCHVAIAPRKDMVQAVYTNNQLPIS